MISSISGGFFSPYTLYLIPLYLIPFLVYKTTPFFLKIAPYFY
jgi:hypothetical protein